MYVKINGLKLYYEKQGSGQPFLLVHGNGEDHRIFDRAVSDLSQYYTVYALDSRGHGKSDPVPTLSYSEMAEDVAEFIRVLELEKPLFCGFSDGGIVGLIAAVRWPDLFSKLVVAGANMTPSGIKQPVQGITKLQNFFFPDAKLDLMLTQPNLTVRQLSSIRVPTLVLAGEYDVIRKEETKRIARSIPGAKCLILPGQTHTSYVIHSDKLFAAMSAFLRD